MNKNSMKLKKNQIPVKAFNKKMLMKKIIQIIQIIQKVHKKINKKKKNNKNHNIL